MRWTFADGHHEGEVVDGHLHPPPAPRASPPVIRDVHEVVGKVEVVLGRDHQELLLQKLRPCVGDLLGSQTVFALAGTATRGEMK